MEPMALAEWRREGRLSLLVATLGIGLGVGTLTAGIRALGLLEALELEAYDALVRWRVDPAPADSRVALVTIREQEIAAYGHPLPDALLARALRRIGDAGARAIGLDLYRPPSTRSASAGATEALADALTDRRVVAIEKLPQPGEPGVPPPPALAGTDQVGFSDLVLDADGVARRGLLFLWEDADAPALSLALRLALRHLAPERITLEPDPADPASVRLGPTAIPPLESDDGAYVGADTGGYQMLLDFRRGYGGFPTHTLRDVLEDTVGEEELGGRTVLLGTTSPSVKDDFVAAHSDGRRVHGVELHAHATDQLLRMALDGDAPLRVWSDRAETAWILAWSLAGALLVLAVRPPLALGLAGAGLLALLVALVWSAFASGLWVPGVPPLLAGAASGALVLAERDRRERVARRAVMDLFGRYVSRQVAEDLWEHRHEFMDGGRPRPQRLVITAMLTDLKGYTTTAERMDAAALMDWVNEYMDAMTRVVEEHGGVVDDYTGDGIKANFGVPRIRSDPERVAEDARAAVRCALAMGHALETLAEGWRERGLPVVPMRVGLCTGEAVGGNLGSADRLKYTTVGDTVNTAARLESFHKEEVETPGPDGRRPLFRVLVAESTRRHLGEAFETEDLGVHKLRGRADPVRIYRVRGERGSANALRRTA